MSMTYTSLVASKATAGSIMNWVSYSKLDVIPIVDEAQTLIFQFLRVREMRSEWTFGLSVGQASVALPSRFLDPIGRIYDLTNGTAYSHGVDTNVRERRAFEPLTGSFGTSPFSTTSGSALVTCTDTAHGLNQDSTITIAAATATGGLTLTGTFAVTSITDANTFVIDAGTEATSTATDGGAVATWTANNLIAASPSCWGVWDEAVKFDTAFDAVASLKLMYYRRPALLSATNLSNWLTDRYPMLVRKACQAAAADYMKDSDEYARQVKSLTDLIGLATAGDDLMLRGAEFGTDTP